jgi:glycosidase
LKEKSLNLIVILKLGNHDRPRIASRYGSERVSALLTFEMTLPGVAITYYVRTGLMFEIFFFKNSYAG